MHMSFGFFLGSILFDENVPIEAARLAHKVVAVLVRMTERVPFILRAHGKSGLAFWWLVVSWARAEKTDTVAEHT